MIDVNRIAQLAAAAEARQSVAVNGNPGDVTYFVANDGTVKSIRAERPRAKLTAATESDFSLAMSFLVNEYKADRISRTVGECRPLVKVTQSTRGIAVDGQPSPLDPRSDLVEMSANWSRAMAALIALPKNHSLDQRGLVDWLRVEMQEASPREALDAFRSVRFAQSSDGESTIEPAKSQLSRKIEASAKSGGVDVPETISFSGYPFVGFDAVAYFGIEVAVSIDFEKQRFVLNVVGDSIASEVLKAKDALAGLIRDVTSNVNAEVICG